MDDTADTAQVIIRPPLAWGLAVIAGLALNWLVPLPFLPADLPASWLGAMLFVLATALFSSAIVTVTRAASIHGALQRTKHCQIDDRAG